jgi:hypothetical protein
MLLPGVEEVQPFGLAILSIREVAGETAAAWRTANLAGMQHVTIGCLAWVNAHVKADCLVAGRTAGADSVDDLDMLPQGAMLLVFGGRGRR